MRVLHVSDLHLALDASSVPWRAWTGKRILSAANLLLGRGKAYADSAARIEELANFRQAQQVDLVISTGDYTAMGTEVELAKAKEAVAELLDAPLGAVTVPGNHDLYASDTVREDRFGHHFGAWMTSDLPEHRLDGTPWPSVRLMGDDVAVVAVNSAGPRPLISSTGQVPPAQLEALRRVLADERLRGRFIFVITHYAPRTEDGRRDRLLHRLRNADAFLAACASVEHGAILCGHVHRRFVTRIEGVRPPIFCAGSSTKAGREGLWVFDVEDGRVRATPGRRSDASYVLEPDGAVELRP